MFQKRHGPLDQEGPRETTWQENWDLVAEAEGTWEAIGSSPSSKTIEGHGSYCPGPGGYTQGLSLGTQFPN